MGFLSSKTKNIVVTVDALRANYGHLLIVDRAATETELLEVDDPDCIIYRSKSAVAYTFPETETAVLIFSSSDENEKEVNDKYTDEVWYRYDDAAEGLLARTESWYKGMPYLKDWLSTAQVETVRQWVLNRWIEEVNKYSS